jgi:hypothetical protein
VDDLVSLWGFKLLCVNIGVILPQIEFSDVQLSSKLATSLKRITDTVILPQQVRRWLRCSACLYSFKRALYVDVYWLPCSLCARMGGYVCVHMCHFFIECVQVKLPPLGRGMASLVCIAVSCFHWLAISMQLANSNKWP